MFGIPNFEMFKKIEPINKGVSKDKKFYVESFCGKHMFLRLADVKKFDRMKDEYKMMERVYELGVRCPEPYSFGLCEGDKSTYALSGWLDGDDADGAWPIMSEAERYDLGLKAGKVLCKIHTLSAPDNAEPWSNRFYRKVQERIDFYHANLIKSEDGDCIVQFLQNNKHLLDSRPQTFNHGDFSIVNLKVMPDGQIGVIDFDYINKGYGDPWWEFDLINWGNEYNVKFYSGFINGYFESKLPSEFFTMLSYYLAYRGLAILCDSSINIYGDPDYGKQCLNKILHWFDNMNSSNPTWYINDFAE
jgi:serine/threonine-protein kinase